MRFSFKKYSKVNDVMLAPMENVNDVAYRELCLNYGAGLTPTMMISVSAIARRNKPALNKIVFGEKEKIKYVQLFGQNTKHFTNAAKYCVEEYDVDVIDLNMGCPYTSIMDQGAGSALLKRPPKIKEIVESITNVVNVPISCKLRLGMNSKQINVLQTSKFCEQAGAELVTIHARTQDQMYSGNAQENWNYIKQVKDQLNIPVCGNGDVWNVNDYLQMKEKTNCDYVMIGRAAMGNPYIFKQIHDYNLTGKYKERTKEQQIKDFKNYIVLAESYEIDLFTIKNYAQRVTKGFEGGAKLRQNLSKCNNVTEIKKLMETLK
jgi:nifR3 family TIM-barrel protein